MFCVTVLQGEDPAAVLVKKKHLWKYQIAVCKDRYKRQKKSKQFCKVVKSFLCSCTHTILSVRDDVKCSLTLMPVFTYISLNSWNT